MSPKVMAEYHTIVMAQKLLKHGEPESLSASLVCNSSVRERSTRQDGLFHLPRPRLETGKRRFGYRAAALLNRVPADAIEQRPARFARAAKAALLSG